MLLVRVVEVELQVRKDQTVVVGLRAQAVVEVVVEVEVVMDSLLLLALSLLVLMKKLMMTFML